MAYEQQKRQAFSRLLQDSNYILALLGAGLSASSGVPTFSGEGATWRGIDAKTIATRDAFSSDPRVVSQYYKEFKQTVEAANPNRGHIALANLARSKPGFLAITQNIDDLSQRAGHPPAQLACLHGSLFTTKCFDEDCSFVESYSVSSIPPGADSLQPGALLTQSGLESIPYPLTCPTCTSSYLRPGVTWFGELLPLGTLDYVDRWIDSVPYIDVMLVIGIGADLSRSAEFIEVARVNGAAIAHFNITANDELVEPEDWIFLGDAAETLPAVLGEALAPNTTPLDTATNYANSRPWTTGDYTSYSSALAPSAGEFTEPNDSRAQTVLGSDVRQNGSQL